MNPEDRAVPQETAPVETPIAEMPTFAELGVAPELVKTLDEMGITSPFPIQAMTLPVALSGHDIIGQAKTGTGKTLGFGVPMLNRTIARGDAGWDDYAYAGKTPKPLFFAASLEEGVMYVPKHEQVLKENGV